MFSEQRVACGSNAERRSVLTTVLEPADPGVVRRLCPASRGVLNVFRLGSSAETCGRRAVRCVCGTSEGSLTDVLAPPFCSNTTVRTVLERTAMDTLRVSLTEHDCPPTDHPAAAPSTATANRQPVSGMSSLPQSRVRRAHYRPPRRTLRQGPLPAMSSARLTPHRDRLGTHRISSVTMASPTPHTTVSTRVTPGLGIDMAHSLLYLISRIVDMQLAAPPTGTSRRTPGIAPTRLVLVVGKGC